MGAKEKNNNFSFLKGILGFSVSAWVNAVLSLFATPIVTRAFAPDELGKINLFIALTNMFLYFAYLGIDQAFTRFYHEPLGKNDKKSWMAVCMILTGIVFGVMLIGIFLFRDIISKNVIGYIGITIPLALAMTIGAQIIIRYFNLAARMEKNIILFNVQAIVSTVITNLSYALVALVSATAENAIIFRTVLSCIAAVLFFAFSCKEFLSLKKMDCSFNVIKDILLYALPVCPAAILATVNNSIGQLLLKKYIDYSAIGIYSNAVTVAAIITIIQNGFNNYWGPFVFENYRTQQKKIIQVHHIISYVMIVFGLAIIIFQDLIYYLLVGKMYWGSKQILPLLLISPILYTIAETLGIGIRLSKKTFLNIPVAVINIVVNVIFCILLLPRLGIIGAGIAAAVSSVCMLIARSYWGEKQYKCSDNYLKLIIALIVLFTVAFIHIFVYTSIIKYPIYFIALLIISLIYREQVYMIWYVLRILLNRIFKRRRA